MPSIRMTPAWSFFAALTVVASSVAAQPTLPRDRAPALPGSIRTYVDRLYAADPRARAEAACQIRRRHTDAAPAIPILLSMLSDDVTVPAIECDMSPWLRREIVKSPDARKWSETSPAKEAAEALAEIGEPAVPGLLQALRHADWKTRKFAAYGLGELEVFNELAKVIAALAERLSDTHPEVRDRSAWALGEIEDPAAVGPLVLALKDSDANVREKAAWALGEIEDPSAVDGLGAALGNASAGLRRQAAWALGEIEDPSAVGVLVQALTDTDADVRQQAAWALGEIEDPGAVGALVRALKDADWRVRKNAAWALGEIEDPSALDDLRRAAFDTNGEVRRAVSQAIRELRNQR